MKKILCHEMPTLECGSSNHTDWVNGALYAKYMTSILMSFFGVFITPMEQNIPITNGDITDNVFLKTDAEDFKIYRPVKTKDMSTIRVRGTRNRSCHVES